MGYLLAVALANALDASSSCSAFRHGAHEGNRLLPTHCATVTGVKIGATFGYAIGARRLARDHHPNLVKILTVGAVAVPTLAAYHNFRLR